ncbi:hypothetical protein SMICM304S_07224 [Streptomyces microflavus]
MEPVAQVRPVSPPATAPWPSNAHTSSGTSCSAEVENRVRSPAEAATLSSWRRLLKQAVPFFVHFCL